MTLIKRANITPPTRRSEAVPVPAFGGDVLVRRLSLSELAEVRGPSDAGVGFVAKLLAVAVVDGDGEQIFDADQWSLWGRDHEADFLALSNAVLRLNGGDAELSKNG